MKQICDYRWKYLRMDLPADCHQDGVVAFLRLYAAYWQHQPDLSCVGYWVRTHCQNPESPCGIRFLELTLISDLPAMAYGDRPRQFSTTRFYKF